jgi:hypothetical protein
MAFDKKILSIDSDDDGKDYEAFSEYLENDTQRKKRLAVAEIDKMGETLLKEIEKKNRVKAAKAKKLIKYILKHCDGKYDNEELQSYSFEDVVVIYNEVHSDEKPTFSKFIRFIFNL